MKLNANETSITEQPEKGLTGLSPLMQRWEVDRQMADVLVKSGFLPPAVNTPEKAIAIMLKGREIGVGPMEAFSSINIIQGKISVSPQLMLALARRTKELEAISIVKDDKLATVTIKRKGFDPVTTQFGIKEATALGLISKDNYKKQAPIMFQWRALAENLRISFGDAIAGMYTPDELGFEMAEDGSTTTGSNMTHTLTNRGPVTMPKPKQQPQQPLPAAIETEAVEHSDN